MACLRRAKNLACVFLALTFGDAPLLAGIGSARAASIEVSPVMVELAPGRMSATMTVTNRSNGASAVQMRAFHWTQTPTDDALAATDDMIVSPPIFQLGAGEQQIVRVLLRKPPGAAEATYRLLLDELPTGQEAGQIQFALACAPVLAWRIVEGEGGAELCVLNRGDRHDRIDRLEVQLPNGRLIRAIPVNNAYVLAGIERRIPLRIGRLDAAGGTVAVTGHDDNGPIDATAAIERVP